MKCSRFSAGFVAVAGFLVLTLLPVLTGFDQHSLSKSSDMDHYHVPVVRSFAEQLPAVDLSDYNVATGPGMHLFLAVLTRVLGPSETMLQVATCVFGALLIGMGWWYASLAAKPWIALAAIVPLGVNPYTLGNAIWVMTDNLSLLFLTIAIGSSIFLRPRTGILVGTSLAMILGILVRQINIWVVAGVWIAALLGCSPFREKLPWRDELDDGFSAGRIVVISIGVLACFGVLLFFIINWEGLVPPSMQGIHTRGINVAVTPFVLTLLAVYGAPAWLLLTPRVLANRQIFRWTALGALLGLCVGVLLESRTGLEFGRAGGWLWLLAGNSPEVAGRSLFLVFGALLGGGLLGALLGMLAEAGRSRAAFLLLVFGASFLAAYTVNSQAFQRYFDGPVLLFIGWCLVLTIRPGNSADERRVLAISALVIIMQCVFSFWTIYRPLSMSSG